MFKRFSRSLSVIRLHQQISRIEGRIHATSVVRPDAGFNLHLVRVVADVGPAPPGLVVIVDATGVRIEGVDVETAAQLVARLR